MNTQHTPTPWTYSGTIDHQHAQKCQLVLQAKTNNAANIAKIIPCAGMTADEVKANAERIVACVNACAGMADPAKEIAEMRAELARLKNPTSAPTCDELDYDSKS